MHPRLVAAAGAQGGVFTTAQAVAHGYTANDVRALVRAGTWVRLRRGVLASRTTTEGIADDARARHLLAAAAARVTLGHDVVLSHRSAALAWRLPLLGHSPADVAFTLERQHRRRAPALELHTAVTPPHHRAVVDGHPTTSVARTVSDIARSRPLRDAVVLADAALHRDLCTSAEIARVVADCPVWPGIARTKRVLEIADRRSESPGESLSRIAFLEAGVAEPEPQVELLLGGQHVRVDFMWVDQRLVGEFDGKVKYGVSDDLWREKLREDLIRRHDYRVVRWTWSDVYPNAGPMLTRVRAALRN